VSAIREPAHQLLRALEPEVPLDDREADDVEGRAAGKGMTIGLSPGFDVGDSVGVGGQFRRLGGDRALRCGGSGDGRLWLGRRLHETDRPKKAPVRRAQAPELRGMDLLKCVPQVVPLARERGDGLLSGCRGSGQRLERGVGLGDGGTSLPGRHPFPPPLLRLVPEPALASRQRGQVQLPAAKP
jgi:hypothetical protein